MGNVQRQEGPYRNFVVATAADMNTLVYATTTANQVDVAGASQDKVIGFLKNQVFNNGDRGTVELLGRATFLAIASGSISVAAYVNSAASGQVASTANKTRWVALNAAAAGEWVEVAEVINFAEEILV